VPIVNVTDISRDHVADAIARMEMDITTVARSHAGLSSGHLKLLRELQSLTAENAALRADKERLDWLAVSDKWFEVPATESFTPDTFRAAIDAARKEQP